MASAVEQLAERDGGAGGARGGGAITRDTTLLIDDDENNVRHAIEGGVKAFWFEPSAPERVVADLCHLAAPAKSQSPETAAAALGSCIA